jgi:hypothetical protein
MMALIAAAVLAQTVPQPEERRPGTDLATLTKAVSELCGKELVHAELGLERRFVTITGGDGAGPDEVFTRYQQILVSVGLALLRDPQSPKRYHIVRLGASLPFSPAEYADPEKLPKGEEVCTLTLRLSALSANRAINLARPRLNGAMIPFCVQGSDMISLTDLASTLRQVGKYIQDHDRAAGECMKPLEVEMWVVSLGEEGPGEDLKELDALMKSRFSFTPKTAARIVGHGVGRLNPGYQAPARGSFTLANPLGFQAAFNGEIERGQVRLTSLVLSGFVERTPKSWLNVELYKGDQVNLSPGKPVVLSSWKNGAATEILVARARIGD